MCIQRRDAENTYEGMIRKLPGEVTPAFLTRSSLRLSLRSLRLCVESHATKSKRRQMSGDYLPRKGRRGFNNAGRGPIWQPEMCEPKRAKRSLRRGSVLMEGPLALLPMLAILFAVMDLSIALFVKNMAQFAVCQGVRYAITSQTKSGMGQDASIKAVVKGYTLGFLDCLSPDHIGGNRITITYYDPVSLAAVAGVGSNAGGNVVVVSASGLSWAWMVPLLHDRAPLAFSVSSAAIMEATPIAGAPAR